MANHLNLINESLDNIVIKDTEPVLFEEFCEDCSEFGVEKEDILDWLSEHDQLWSDCDKHFAMDPSWLSADELEAFICDHDEACYDYMNHFGLRPEPEEELDESKETSQDLSEYQKWVDYDMEKYHKISDITMKKIKKAGLSVVKDQYGEYEVIADRPIDEAKSFDFDKINKKLHGNVRL